MYIDTSALVKLFTKEPDSDACEAVVGGASLVSSELSYCEFRSAILAKLRLGAISAEESLATWGKFEHVLAEGRMQLVSLSREIVRDATQILVRVHPAVPLRTLDALHLATFLSVEAGPLFTKDKRMREAATALNCALAD